MAAAHLHAPSNEPYIIRVYEESYGRGHRMRTEHLTLCKARRDVNKIVLRQDEVTCPWCASKMGKAKPEHGRQTPKGILLGAKSA